MSDDIFKDVLPYPFGDNVIIKSSTNKDKIKLKFKAVDVDGNECIKEIYVGDEPVVIDVNKGG